MEELLPSFVDELEKISVPLSDRAQKALLALSAAGSIAAGTGIGKATQPIGGPTQLPAYVTHIAKGNKPSTFISDPVLRQSRPYSPHMTIAGK